MHTKRTSRTCIALVHGAVHRRRELKAKPLSSRSCILQSGQRASLSMRLGLQVSELVYLAAVLRLATLTLRVRVESGVRWTVLLKALSITPRCRSRVSLTHPRVHVDVSNEAAVGWTRELEESARRLLRVPRRRISFGVAGAVRTFTTVSTRMPGAVRGPFAVAPGPCAATCSARTATRPILRVARPCQPQ
jgi:hypothetical protein